MPSHSSPVPLSRLLFAAVALTAVLAAVISGALSPGRAAAHASRATTAPLLVRALSTAPGGDTAGSPVAQAASPRPLTPAQISAAYGLPVRGAAHQTIAVVSAYNDPTVESDLAKYDQHLKLPACTKANGCLRVINMEGKTSPLPEKDASGGMWTTESALGTQLAHALCQSCRIVLAEADFASASDFSTAAQAAGAAGAGVVVTTYTPSENPVEFSFEPPYANPHTSYVAATGDAGYSGALNFPAALPNVLAVGGTNLTLNASGGYGHETAWNGTVSGCSIYLQAPAWQSRIQKVSGCAGNRAGSDVSAMASPGTIIYATDINGTLGGSYYAVQGTSVSAPIIGSVIALSGSQGAREAQALYARQLKDPTSLHDVTSGNDAAQCNRDICRAQRGWDGPTGFGTPAGLEAFLPNGPALSGAHPRLTVSTARAGLAVSRSGAASPTLANGNPFRVTGTVSLQRTLRVNGRLQLVTFGRTRFVRTSLQTGTVRMTLAPAQRSQLLAAGRLQVVAVVTAKGASGRTVTVRRNVTLVAP